MYSRVLVAMPTADKKDYCVEKFIKQIKTFTYPNYDIFVLDNSKDPNHVKLFWKNGIKAQHEPIKGDFREELARHQNIIRNYFLNGNYDYLLMIESDVFTGECIIENLVSYADVYSASLVTATYEIRKKENVLCLTATSDSRRVRSEKIMPRNAGYSLMGQGCLPLRQMSTDVDYKITATGIGCTLFSREVLEEIPFRVDLTLNKNAFSDTFYFTDAQKKGYEVLINSDLVLHHDK
jgi:hypothetical protein